MPDGLPPEFTGERVIPGQVDVDLFNEHVSRYAFARGFAKGKRVLDLGCGTGYGAFAMAQVAASVTGVDLSQDAINHARLHYPAANLKFEQGDVTEVREGAYDLMIAFEVIEHLENWRGLLRSASGQLTHEGWLLVSTPNKPVYAEARGASGGNEFHVHEFEYEEFQQALAEVFPHVKMLVQNHSAGLLFAPVHGVGACEVQLSGAVSLAEAQFFVGVCSHAPIADVNAFFYLPTQANLLRDRDRHIELLRGEMDLKTEWMEVTRAELAGRNREYEELLRLNAELKRQVEERNEWALRQDELARARGERILGLQDEVETGQAEWALAAAAYEERVATLEDINRAKTEWALETERRLGAELTERSEHLMRAVELLAAAEALVEERTLWAQRLDVEIREWEKRWSGLRNATWVRVGSGLGLVK